MPFDGARADDQPGRNLGVGEALTDQPSDLGFLGGEFGGGFDAALADVLAGGGQLLGGAFGKGPCAHRCEYLVRGAQLLARVPATVRPAQPLAVLQVGASELAADQSAAEPLDG